MSEANEIFKTKTQPMRGVPMARVCDPETGKEIARGWYAAYPATTFCFAEDYQRNPPRLVEGIVCWQMTDWGLSNKIGFREVTPPHKIELIPQGEEFDGESGNGAALREVCKRVIAFIGNLEIEPHSPLDESASELKDKAIAALSAPSRNCDKADKWLDLYCHFHPPKGMREMPPEWVDAISAFCRWVVAPAQEEEGGGDVGK